LLNPNLDSFKYRESVKGLADRTVLLYFLLRHSIQAIRTLSVFDQDVLMDT